MAVYTSLTESPIDSAWTRSTDRRSRGASCSVFRRTPVRIGLPVDFWTSVFCAWVNASRPLPVRSSRKKSNPLNCPKPRIVGRLMKNTRASCTFGATVRLHQAMNCVAVVLR